MPLEVTEEKHSGLGLLGMKASVGCWAVEMSVE